MALNIKNPKVERLVAEVADLAGESKTEAVRKALEERRERLAYRVSGRRRVRRFFEFLEAEIWPRIEAGELDQPPLTKAERERILGYGREGV
jgi:antitoxin VapB